MESPALLPSPSFKQDLEGFHTSCIHPTSKVLHINNLIRNSGGTANKAQPSPNQPGASQGRNLGDVPCCLHRPCPLSVRSLRKWLRKLLRSH